MTLEEIKAIPDDWITVEQMADFLKCDEQALRMQAKKDRESIEYLGPVTIGKEQSFGSLP